MESFKSHVVFVTFPVLSHINPVLHFSKRLVSKGVKVTISPPVSMANSVKSDDPNITIEPYSDGWDGGFKQAPDVATYMQGFNEFGLKNISKLVETQQTPVTCVAYSSYFPSVLSIAKQFGLIAAAVFVTPCSANAIHYHVHQGRLTAPVEHPVTISLPGLPLLETRDLPTTVSNKHSHLFLQMCLDQFSNLHQADWLLFNSFDALEDEVVKWLDKQWPKKVITIGSCVPLVNPTPVLSPSIEWLNTKDDGSVVYIAFGSAAGLSEDQNVELAWALKETDMNFLWILGDADKEKLPKEFQEEITKKGLIIPWCLQLEVLAHKAIGCFVNHGGWNSALEAMSFGVPMVAMPQFIDHTIVAKYIQDVWGVGVRVNKDYNGITSRNEIERSIKVVKENDIIKKNADKWRVSLKEAASVGGSSDRNTDLFIASLTSSLSV